MKSMNAVKFRLILSVLLSIAVILIAAAFIFGYRHLQSVGEDTRRRQADAIASEDSIGNLQRLQLQLSKLDGLTEQLSTLKSSSSLPQFDTTNNSESAWYTDQKCRVYRRYSGSTYSGHDKYKYNTSKSNTGSHN